MSTPWATSGRIGASLTGERMRGRDWGLGGSHGEEVLARRQGLEKGGRRWPGTWTAVARQGRGRRWCISPCKEGKLGGSRAGGGRRRRHGGDRAHGGCRGEARARRRCGTAGAAAGTAGAEREAERDGRTPVWTPTLLTYRVVEICIKSSDWQTCSKAKNMCVHVD